MAELPAETLGLIRRLSNLAETGEDIQGFFTEVVRLCADISGATETSIMLVDQEQAALVVSASHGVDEGDGHRISFQIGEGIAGRVLETGEAERFDDVVGDPGFVSLPGQQGRIHAMMVVPDSAKQLKDPAQMREMLESVVI